MPYPNEHSCRLRDPEGLEIVGSGEREHDGKKYRVIFGKPKDGDGSVEQAYRYPVESWSEESARNHCTSHEGSFHAAEKKTESFEQDFKLLFNLQFLTEKADPNIQIFPWSMPARYYMKPGRMIIYGTALTAGQTRKGDAYSLEELKRSARSLIGGPIELFEHTWDVKELRWLPHPQNIILDAEEVNGRLEYIAGIDSNTLVEIITEKGSKEMKIQDLIRQGDINHVSINAICRYVPPEDPSQCNGMILNGFCLLHKDSIPSSPGTCVKVWNSFWASAQRLKSVGKPSCFSESEKGVSKLMTEKKKDEKKTAQVVPSVEAPAAGIVRPSIEDRVKTLEEKFEGFQQYVTQEFTGINAKLDTLIQTKASTAAVSLLKTATEWDTEYINNLPDECFAHIEAGGEKDEQGKTVPRSLRHLPFKNAQGEIDHDHLVAALQAIKGARQGQPPPYASEAKPKLCGAVETWNREHDNKIESDVCEVHPEEKTEQAGEPGGSPPEPNETKEPPKEGEPKTDQERFMAHYGLTEEQMNQVLEWIGEDVYKLLPERGQKTEKQRKAKTEQMSVEEIKARIGELSKQREQIMQQLYPEAELTDEERINLSSQLGVIDSEIKALEQALGERIGQSTKTEKPVIAAVKPVENEPVMVTLTEQEILDVLKDRRRFTPALQVNGVLDLLEKKRKEIE